MSENPVRVLVVDDAAFMRRSVIKLLATEDDIEVVGEAANGREAVESFRELKPDVICLDIDMPQMDGITAVKYIMALRPTPILIISSMTDRYDIPFEVLRLGVVGFFPKPSSLQEDPEEQVRLLLYMIRSARQVREGKLQRVPCGPPADVARGKADVCKHLLAIGGTLGSVGPLIRIFSNLPADLDPGAAIIFDVPLHPAITESFLESMGNLFGWDVVLVSSETELRAGVAYFIPAGLSVSVEDAKIKVESGGGEYHLDHLFTAASAAFGAKSTVVLLAGDREDGMDGLRSAAHQGAKVYLQDESSALFSSWAPEESEEVYCFDLDHIIELLRGDIDKTSI